MSHHLKLYLCVLDLATTFNFLLSQNFHQKYAVPRGKASTNNWPRIYTFMDMSHLSWIVILLLKMSHSSVMHKLTNDTNCISYGWIGVGWINELPTRLLCLAFSAYGLSSSRPILYFALWWSTSFATQLIYLLKKIKNIFHSR